MKRIRKAIKFLRSRRKYSTALNYITENFNLYQINKDDPSKSGFIPLYLLFWIYHYHIKVQKFSSYQNF